MLEEVTELHVVSFKRRGSGLEEAEPNLLEIVKVLHHTHQVVKHFLLHAPVISRVRLNRNELVELQGEPLHRLLPEHSPLFLAFVRLRTHYPHYSFHWSAPLQLEQRVQHVSVVLEDSVEILQIRSVRSRPVEAREYLSELPAERAFDSLVERASCLLGALHYLKAGLLARCEFDDLLESDVHGFDLFLLRLIRKGEFLEAGDLVLLECEFLDHAADLLDQSFLVASFHKRHVVFLL